MRYDSFSPPVTGLPPDAFAAFFQAGPAVPYRKGQLIYMQGQTPDYLYCLKEGIVRTVILSDQGEEKLLTVYRSGSIFGEASFFDGGPRVSTAAAQSSCRIIRLSHETVDSLFRADPALASAMIAYLAGTVRLLSAHVDTMSFQRARQRLCRLLLHYSAEDSAIHATHEELASVLGVSRVTVSRILGSLAEQGLLKTGYGTVTLLDRQGLEACESLPPR